ncbi:MAG: quinolinate synthase NadA [Acutalibacteraceae bacterium]|jgi:quinolinate synthase
MTTYDMQREILKLKKQNGIYILAHVYQSQDILEIADFTGDSFALSEAAAKATAQTVLMCGVRFMAETVKILSPGKKVILSHREAGCPMAQQLKLEELSRLKELYPGYATVAYINTSAELKTICDVCVTSSSAVKIIGRMKGKDILFIPDPNLGAYIAKQLPQKNFKLIGGGCPVHSHITTRDVEQKRAAYPNALLLVHPECRPEVSEMADFVGSTTGIISYAQNSDKREYIIGTENSIVQHLQFGNPDKRFYPLSNSCNCCDMRLTTLPEVLSCVRLSGGEEITLPGETLKKARRCIDEMLRLGNE